MDNNRGSQSGPDIPKANDPFRWLRWARELQALAQNGLTYATDPYDVERYQRIEELTAEMLAHQTGAEDLTPILGLLRHDSGYATPKVDVRGAVFHDGRLLLVRELADEGRWTLPGGWADPNDLPSAAVEREIEEETGYRARVTRLAAVYDRGHPRHGHQPPFLFHVYKLLFLCALEGGEARASEETGESRFFAENELPDPGDLSISRVSPDQLRHLFRAHANPELPTDFD